MRARSNSRAKCSASAEGTKNSTAMSMMGGTPSRAGSGAARNSPTVDRVTRAT
jgi:hypothetical protein